MKKILSLLLCSLVTLSACSKESSAELPMKYKKDSLAEITFEYPKSYKEDYRNENQVSYLLNGNEGIIFILRWDKGIATDMDERGVEKKVDNIDGYYWKDKEDYNFGFKVKTEEDSHVYFVSADNKEVFWHIVESIEILK